jgi:hypothetical protein
VGYIYGRRARVFRVPSLRLCSIFGQVDGATGEDGLSGMQLFLKFLQVWLMCFQEVMMFLQALPTKNWNEKDIELLLSEAFIWQSLFRGSSAHLKNASTPMVTYN